MSTNDRRNEERYPTNGRKQISTTTTTSIGDIGKSFSIFPKACLSYPLSLPLSPPYIISLGHADTCLLFITHVARHASLQKSLSHFLPSVCSILHSVSLGISGSDNLRHFTLILSMLQVWRSVEVYQRSTAIFLS